ncbi:hypothetical protein DPMN_087009 [Dreissena polymorpha]|uniref:Uncharacterized protein n=1 Tax=Dreissena polymorpha TaxID=45954 RepID=A0A9D4KRG4_DREPO|nr:hypothetical protein DPMN_087009 [Dreissena polymorpha]
MRRPCCTSRCSALQAMPPPPVHCVRSYNCEKDVLLISSRVKVPMDNNKIFLVCNDLPFHTITEPPP